MEFSRELCLSTQLSSSFFENVKLLNEDSIAQILWFWKNLMGLFIAGFGMLAQFKMLLRLQHEITKKNLRNEI